MLLDMNHFKVFNTAKLNDKSITDEEYGKHLGAKTMVTIMICTQPQMCYC